MRENADQINSEYGHFFCSVILLQYMLYNIYCNIYVV